MRLVLLSCLSIAAAWATTITGPLKTPIGSTLFSGTVTITAPSITAANGDTMAAWQQSYPVTEGVFEVSLSPNDTATPAGTSYIVRYRTSTTSYTWQEVWVVPTSEASLTVAQVRVALVPTPSLTLALQQLSPIGAAKGALVAYGTSWGILTPGTDGQVLAADPTAARGVKWATAPHTSSGTSAPPSSCSVGEVYVRTDTNQAYQCTSTDTWKEVTQPVFSSGTSAPPSTCSVGQVYVRTDTNQVYQCTSTDTWTELTGSSGGGASAVADLTDCAFTRISGTVLTMAACRVRVGTLVSVWPQTTFTLDAAVSDTVRFYVLNGSLVAGYGSSSTSITGSGFVTQSGISGFPDESVPLMIWPATTTVGEWNASGTDQRTLPQSSAITPGNGLLAEQESTGVRRLYIDQTTVPQFSSGTSAPPSTCSVGQEYIRTDTNQPYKCTSANTYTSVVTPSSSTTLTNKTLDVEATGNSVTTVELIRAVAAKCQNGAAGAAANLPATYAPTPICVTGTNTLFGVLQWPDSDGDYNIQDSFRLPTDWTGSVDFSLKWRTSATTGDVVWQLSTACVADGETSDPSFNTAQTVTDAAKGTASQQNDASVSSVTTTGCAAGEMFYWKLLRNRTHTSDTLAAAAELISYEWKLRRAQ